ncbi:APC family permease [Phaeacidiphilus oryzae]|uniref:APC family permease n=1 Tax=Phaeacidiphilus oryzae TaxID=348818 RepID=UPI000562EAE2|nr:APC family permease [Phaeacidiphilus oryzae]
MPSNVPSSSTAADAGARAEAAGTTLERSLSLRDLIVYGLLFIGPTAPMGVYGVLDAKSGGVSPLVFVVATVAMGFTAWSYARMSASVPRAGSVFAYATAGLGRTPGFIAGWMVGLDYLFIPSLAALFTGVATHALLPGLPMWLASGGAVVVITVLNLAGVRIAARVGMLMLAVEIVILAMFTVAAIVVLVHDGPARPWLSPFTGVNGFSVTAVVGAVSVAVLSFLGFDAIAGFAEENTGSSRQVGRALIFCLVLAGVLFVVQTYLGSLLTTATPAQLAAHPADQGSAFYTMLQHAISGWFGTTVTTVRAIGPIFSALVGQAAVSRLMLGMARDGHLPRVLATVNPRTRTPLAATLVAAVLTAIISVSASLRADGLDLLSSLVTVGALTAFVFLHASVVGYFGVRRQGSGRGVADFAVPVVGAAIIIAVLVEASRLALAVAGVWLVIGLLVHLAGSLRGRRRAPGSVG